jgi:hypothetical protein
MVSSPSSSPTHPEPTMGLTADSVPVSDNSGFRRKPSWAKVPVKEVDDASPRVPRNSINRSGRRSIAGPSSMAVAAAAAAAAAAVVTGTEPAAAATKTETVEPVAVALRPVLATSMRRRVSAVVYADAPPPTVSVIIEANDDDDDDDDDEGDDLTWPGLSRQRVRLMHRAAPPPPPPLALFPPSSPGHPRSSVDSNTTVHSSVKTVDMDEAACPPLPLPNSDLPAVDQRPSPALIHRTSSVNRVVLPRRSIISAQLDLSSRVTVV